MKRCWNSYPALWIIFYVFLSIFVMPPLLAVWACAQDIPPKPTVPVSPNPDIPEPELKVLKQEWREYFRRKWLATPHDEKPYSEREWQEFIKEKYEADTEQYLFDGSRVDMVNRVFAIEVDWADKNNKWAEAFGQAAWYAARTHRKPAILLLMRVSIRSGQNDSKDMIALRKRVAANCYKAMIVAESNGTRVYLEKLYHYTN